MRRTFNLGDSVDLGQLMRQDLAERRHRAEPAEAAQAAEREKPKPRVDFDQGVRNAAPPPPGMNEMLRAQRFGWVHGPPRGGR